MTVAASVRGPLRLLALVSADSEDKGLGGKEEDEVGDEVEEEVGFDDGGKGLNEEMGLEGGLKEGGLMLSTCADEGALSTIRLAKSGSGEINYLHRQS